MYIPLVLLLAATIVYFRRRIRQIENRALFDDVELAAVEMQLAHALENISYQKEFFEREKAEHARELKRAYSLFQFVSMTCAKCQKAIFYWEGAAFTNSSVYHLECIDRAPAGVLPAQSV